MTTGRVVVGVDGSERGARAVAWAADEAVRRHATLHVVHAWMPPYPLGPTELFADLSSLERRGQALLDRTYDDVTRRAHTPSFVERTLTMNDTSTALLDASAAADLLVIGDGRGTRFLGFSIGSVTRRCAERASCPVVVVSDVDAAADGGRVVVGVDGSAPSGCALRWAAHEASLRGVPLDVVHAWEAPPTASASLIERTMATCLAESQALSPAMRPRSVRGPAAATLVSAARGADLLVVGARSRSRLRDRLLGSTTQHCIEHAPCPVAVVHADDGWSRRHADRDSSPRLECDEEVSA